MSDRHHPIPWWSDHGRATTDWPRSVVEHQSNTSPTSGQIRDDRPPLFFSSTGRSPRPSPLADFLLLVVFPVERGSTPREAPGKLFNLLIGIISISATRSSRSNQCVVCLSFAFLIHVKAKSNAWFFVDSSSIATAISPGGWSGLVLGYLGSWRISSSICYVQNNSRFRLS